MISSLQCWDVAGVASSSPAPPEVHYQPASPLKLTNEHIIHFSFYLKMTEHIYNPTLN